MVMGMGMGNRKRFEGCGINEVGEWIGLGDGGG